MMNKRIGLGLIIFALAMLWCACTYSGEDELGGIRVTPEVLESVSAALASGSQTESNEDSAYVTTEMGIAESKETGPAVSETKISAESVSATVEIMQTEEITSATFADAEVTVVYWTENGTVYHLRKDCSSLRRSTHILQGSIEEAIVAKKERVCKSCS